MDLTELGTRGDHIAFRAVPAELQHLTDAQAFGVSPGRVFASRFDTRVPGVNAGEPFSDVATTTTTFRAIGAADRGIGDVRAYDFTRSQPFVFFDAFEGALALVDAESAGSETPVTHVSQSGAVTPGGASLVQRARLEDGPGPATELVGRFEFEPDGRHASVTDTLSNGSAGSRTYGLTYAVPSGSGDGGELEYRTSLGSTWIGDAEYAALGSSQAAMTLLEGAQAPREGYVAARNSSFAATAPDSRTTSWCGTAARRRSRPA